MNLELDLRFSSAKILNLELNFEFGPRGSGSNFGSEPNYGNTMLASFSALQCKAEGCQNIVARVKKAYIEFPLPVFRVIGFYAWIYRPNKVQTSKMACF